MDPDRLCSAQSSAGTCSAQTIVSSRSCIYNQLWIVMGTDACWWLFVYIQEDLKNTVIPATLTYHFVFWLCHRNFHFFSTWIITGRARSKIHHLFLLLLEAVCYCLDGFCPFFPGKIQAKTFITCDFRLPSAMARVTKEYRVTNVLWWIDATYNELCAFSSTIKMHFQEHF